MGLPIEIPFREVNILHPVVMLSTQFLELIFSIAMGFFSQVCWRICMVLHPAFDGALLFCPKVEARYSLSGFFAGRRGLSRVFGSHRSSTLESVVWFPTCIYLGRRTRRVGIFL